MIFASQIASKDDFISLLSSTPINLLTLQPWEVQDKGHFQVQTDLKVVTFSREDETLLKGNKIALQVEGSGQFGIDGFYFAVDTSLNDTILLPFFRQRVSGMCLWFSPLVHCWVFTSDKEMIDYLHDDSPRSVARLGRCLCCNSRITSFWLPYQASVPPAVWKMLDKVVDLRVSVVPLEVADTKGMFQLLSITGATQSILNGLYSPFIHSKSPHVSFIKESLDFNPEKVEMLFNQINLCWQIVLHKHDEKLPTLLARIYCGKDVVLPNRLINTERTVFNHHFESIGEEQLQLKAFPLHELFTHCKYYLWIGNLSCLEEHKDIGGFFEPDDNADKATFLMEQAIAFKHIGDTALKLIFNESQSTWEIIDIEANKVLADLSTQYGILPNVANIDNCCWHVWNSAHDDYFLHPSMTSVLVTSNTILAECEAKLAKRKEAKQSQFSFIANQSLLIRDVTGEGLVQSDYTLHATTCFTNFVGDVFLSSKMLRGSFMYEIEVIAVGLKDDEIGWVSNTFNDSFMSVISSDSRSLAHCIDWKAGDVICCTIAIFDNRVESLLFINGLQASKVMIAATSTEDDFVFMPAISTFPGSCYRINFGHRPFQTATEPIANGYYESVHIAAFTVGDANVMFTDQERDAVEGGKYYCISGISNLADGIYCPNFDNKHDGHATFCHINNQKLHLFYSIALQCWKLVNESKDVELLRIKCFKKRPILPHHLLLPAQVQMLAFAGLDEARSYELSLLNDEKFMALQASEIARVFFVNKNLIGLKPVDNNVCYIHSDYSVRFICLSSIVGEIALSSRITLDSKFYFEVEVKNIIEEEFLRIGWVSPKQSHGRSNWMIDGVNKLKSSDSFLTSEPFGSSQRWQNGDCIGCAIECSDERKAIQFSVNGNFDLPNGLAFAGFEFEDVVFLVSPMITACRGTELFVNFGDRPFRYSPPDSRYMSLLSAQQSICAKRTELIVQEGIPLELLAARNEYRLRLHTKEIEEATLLKNFAKLEHHSSNHDLVLNQTTELALFDAVPANFRNVPTADLVAQLHWILTEATRIADNYWDEIAKIKQQSSIEATSIKRTIQKLNNFKQELELELQQLETGVTLPLKEQPLPPFFQPVVVAPPVVSAPRTYIKIAELKGVQSSGSCIIVDGLHYHGSMAPTKVKAKFKHRDLETEINREFNFMKIFYEHRLLSKFVKPIDLFLGEQGEIISEAGENLSEYRCIVMEWGQFNLEDHLRRKENINISELLTIAETLLDIVIAAHSCKVVIMDLKPSNIVRFIDGEGEVFWKAIDFDNSRFVNENIGAFTPAYAAFEIADMALGGRVVSASPSMDICSLGWIVWKMLNGGKSLWDYLGIGDDEDSILRKLKSMNQQDIEVEITRTFGAHKAVVSWLTKALRVDPRERNDIHSLKNSTLFQRKDATRLDSDLLAGISKVVEKQADRIIDHVDALADRFSDLNQQIQMDFMQRKGGESLLTEVLDLLRTQQQDAKANDIDFERLLGAVNDVEASLASNFRDILDITSATAMGQSEQLTMLTEMMQSMQSQLDTIARFQKQQLSILSRLDAAGNRMPHLFCILPEMKEASKTVSGKMKDRAMQLFSKAYSILWNRSRLIFICPVTLEMVS